MSERVPKTLDDLSNRAAFPDPIPTVDLTPAQRERAIELLSDAGVTLYDRPGDRRREVALDEMADLLGIDRAAWRDREMDKAMQMMRSVGCTCDVDQSGCKFHGMLPTHGHA